MDLVLINPGGRRLTYQKLASELAGVEPPLWIGLLASFARGRGISVAVIDADAEGLDPEATACRVAEIDPLLAVVVVFGANPSASTQKMTVAGAICSAMAQDAPTVKRALAGLHVSALPERTLREEDVDFVIEGEGPYTLEALVAALRAGGDGLDRAPGLWYWDEGQPAHTERPPLVADLDADLPGAAWDLLPMDRYRAHNWHCFDDIDRRSPYAVIYTSLGCPFTCSFCCINAVFGKPGIRYRSPESVLAEIDLLVERYGVRNIKVIDELFVLKRDRVERICDMIIGRGYDLNFWVYARVDTVERDLLAKMKRAGFNWLAYGFESASQRVRDGVGKRSSDGRTAEAIAWTREAGMHIIANFIFGLPDDDLDTMAETLAMAKDSNFEFVNFYCAMAYPGSKLYAQAIEQGWPLPESWHQYAQFGRDTLPLPTKHISAADVLRFRDRAFEDYFSDPRYQNMVLDRFGARSLEHIREMLSYKMVRQFAPPLGKDA